MPYQLEKTGAIVDTTLKEEYDNQPKVNYAWDDLVGSLIARRLESTQGTLNYNYAENSITMQSGGGIGDTRDRLIFNLQKPHAMCDNCGMHLHIHWEQVNSNKIEFTLQYRVQANGTTKTTAWTTVTANSDDNSKFTYTSGTLNQITEIAIIDCTGTGISATVEFRLARTDLTTGNIEATFVDAHVARDQLGSRLEYQK